MEPPHVFVFVQFPNWVIQFRSLTYRRVKNWRKCVTGLTSGVNSIASEEQKRVLIFLPTNTGQISLMYSVL